MRCKWISVLMILVASVFLFLPAQAEDAVPSGAWEGSFLIPGFEKLLTFRIVLSEDQQCTMEITYDGGEALSTELRHIADDKYRLEIDFEDQRKTGYNMSNNDVYLRPFLSDESEYWLNVYIDTFYVTLGNGEHGISFPAAPEGFYERPYHSAGERFEMVLDKETENITPVFCTDDITFVKGEWVDYSRKDSRPFLIRFQLDRPHTRQSVDEIIQDLTLLASDHTVVQALKTIWPEKEDGEEDEGVQVFDLVYFLDSGGDAEALLVRGKAYDLAGLPHEAEALGREVTPELLLDRMYYAAGCGEDSRIGDIEWLSGDPFIQGKMLIGVYESSDRKSYSTQSSWFLGELEDHPERLANSIEEAGTLVLITKKWEQHGKYDNGGLAYRTYTYMYIMNMAQNASWTRILVAVEDPPESGYVKAGTSGGLSGEFKPEEAVQMLLEMEYIP